MSYHDGEPVRMDRSSKPTINGSEVVVIIPTYGHFDYACRAVRSLAKQPTGAAISAIAVIVDDASPEWLSVDWSMWPDPEVPKFHFDDHCGLTRSWNAGLAMAMQRSARYAVCTNSDVLFSPGWFTPLADALDQGFDLVGPVTNAPGHAIWQNVVPFCAPDAPLLTDSEQHIGAIAARVTSKLVGPIEAPINGFFMMAETETWRKGALTPQSVFDPKFPLAHNEVELQNRWYKAGMKIGFVPQSYIFHYRSVSRTEGLAGNIGAGAYRSSETC